MKREQFLRRLFLLIVGYFSVSIHAKRHYCMNNEHIQGRWVLNMTKIQEKSFICCGWDNGDFLDPNICGSSLHPRAVNTTNLKGSNMYYAQPGGHACVCDTREGVFDVNKREKYYWHPANCTLPRWNAKRFCSLLQNRKILMIGDSTNRQTSSTLMAMVTAGNGSCAEQIFSSRSDNLVSLANGSKDLLGLIKAHDIPPDIVVISAGAHFRSIIDYENNWLGIRQQLERIHETYPNLKIIWKTQNPGHVECAVDTSPISTYEKRNEKKDIYSWNLHPEFDRISAFHIHNISNFYSTKMNQTNIQSSHTPFIQVMDLFPLYLRPDAHPHYVRDCLHYCLPGPLNLFSILFLNLLITGSV